MVDVLPILELVSVTLVGQEFYVLSKINVAVKTVTTEVLVTLTLVTVFVTHVTLEIIAKIMTHVAILIAELMVLVILATVPAFAMNATQVLIVKS